MFVLLSYGQLHVYFENLDDAKNCSRTFASTEGGICKTVCILNIVLMVSSVPLLLDILAKIFHDRQSYFHRLMWQHWPEDFLQFAVFVFVFVDFFVSFRALKGLAWSRRSL